MAQEMITTIVTPPSVEPVSLTEAKAHLRLDSNTFAESVDESQSIVPGDHVVAASYSLVGAGVDVLGVQTLVILNSGTNGTGGTVDCKIQESDDDITYTDWAGGAFTQVTEANDNAIQEIEYTGNKQYIRAVATVAVATCDFAATMIEKTAVHADDDLVSTLITVAREYAETVTGRALITQTWDGYLNRWPYGDAIRISFPTLQSITGIFYKDEDGNETEFASANYITETDREPGRAVLQADQSWPTSNLYPSLPIRVRFVAGYGTAGSDVPDSINQAILIYLATLYENREDFIDAQTYQIPAPFTVKSLLTPYRVWL